LHFARRSRTKPFPVKIYGTGQTLTGGNFSYVVCGLTIGTTWDGCGPRNSPRKAGRCKASKQMGRTALFNGGGKFPHAPDIFFGRLQSNLSEFFAQLPDMIWTGYIASTKTKLGISDLMTISPSWVFHTS